MAMSQNCIEKGSDEIDENGTLKANTATKDKVIDFCSFCITRGKHQPATHFCFDCGPFGRYICGTCEQHHEMFLSDHTIKRITEAKGEPRYDKMTECQNKMKSLLNQHAADELKHKKEIDFWKTEHDNRSKELHSYREETDKLLKEKQQLDEKEKSMNREIDALNQTIADEKRKSEDSIKKLIQERDDLKDRYDTMIEPNKKENALSKERQNMIIQMESQLNQYSSDELKHKKEIDFWKTEHDNRSKEIHAYKEEIDKLFKEKYQLEIKEKSVNREIDALNQTIADEKRKSEDNIKKLIQERDELRDRYDKMTECQNKMKSLLNQHAADELKHKKEIDFWKAEHDNRSKEIHSYREEMDKLFKEKHKLDEKEKSMNREIDALNQTIADEKRKSEDNIKKLIQERDELKDRFSKVAGAELSDIADLSDPNRAMKLSERFGQLYDYEWTNAFEALTDEIGMHDNGAIRMLLEFLKECLAYCEKTIKSQIDNNMFLHPIQCPKSAASEGMQGMRERQSNESKEVKTLRELRRQIIVHPVVIEEIKQAFIVEVKSWKKKGIEKKHVYACETYLQKCAELCWLIVRHDPPLFMKFDVKPGEKLDPNVYTAYSASGNNIDFLVWPPLYNGENGGLLSKGTAEPIRSVKKGK